MTEKDKSHRTQITVAVIGLVGVLGVALVANWDKIFPPASPPIVDVISREEPAEPPNQREMEPESPARLNLPEAQREAEKITAQWVESWQSGDVATLVKISIPPFFLDNEILVSSSDLRDRYQAAARKTRGKRFSIDRIMSGSIEEYKSLGYVTTKDRLLSRMQLSDDDLVVILIISTETLKEEGIGFYFRRLSDKVEMAGFWD